MAERDRGGGECEPLQLLGMEHRGRVTDATDSEWEHADDPSSDTEPSAFIARVQSVRAQLGHIRSDGRANAALPSRLLLER